MKNGKFYRLFVTVVAVLITMSFVSVPSAHTVLANSQLDWPMFMHDSFHTGISASQISPPFFERFKILLDAPSDCSPIVSEGRMYIGDKMGNMYCVDTNDGKTIWKRSISNGNAINSTPNLYEGSLLFGDSEGNFLCISADSGAKKWSFQVGGAILSSPLIVKMGDKTYVLFGSEDRTVYCLDAFSGNLVWEYTTGNSVFSSPALFKDSIVVASYDGFLYRFDIPTGKIIWKLELTNTLNGVSNKIFASPSVDSDTGTIFIGSYNHYFYAINGDTGDIKWQTDLGEVIYSTASVFGNTIICGAKNKVVAVDKDTGAIKWTFGCSGYLLSSPTVEGGFILVEEKNGEFSCLNMQGGERVWNFDAKSGTKSVPIAVGNNAYFVGDKVVYAFSDKQHSENPILFVSGNSINFGKVEKGDSASKYITLKNVRTDVMTGDIIGLLSGTVSTNVEWIEVSPKQFSANVQVIMVTINTSNLDEDQGYAGKIFIKTNGGNAVLDVVLYVKLNPNPILAVTVDEIERTIKNPGEPIQSQFNINNLHKDKNGRWVGTLKGTISSKPNWIEVSPKSFMSNKQLVIVTIDTSTFERGKDYSGMIEIKSNGGNKNILITIHCTKPEKKKIIITLQPNNPMMTVNGVKQEIDPGRGTKPVIIAKWSRTVVPIRAIVEALGGTIGWDGTERKVTINFKDTVIELWIDKPQASVNGVMKWIDEGNHNVKPIIVNGRTMLPLRFVAENLGGSVQWDPKTKTIIITFEI